MHNDTIDDSLHRLQAIVTRETGAVLGAAGARLGGAPMVRPALRVFVGGAAAMGIAWLVGQLFDVQVA